MIKKRLRIILFFLVFVILLLVGTRDVGATCSDPNCQVSGSSGAWCANIANLDTNCNHDPYHDGCSDPSSCYERTKVVNIDLCGSCSPDTPDCVWTTFWNASCGSCCGCTGSGCASLPKRFNGTISANDTADHRWTPDGSGCLAPTGVGVACSGGVCASIDAWNCDAYGGYFDATASRGDQAVSVALTPATGYVCNTWQIIDTSNNSVVNNGTGCTATITSNPDNWSRTIQFSMLKLVPLACTITGPAQVTLGNSATYNVTATGSNLDKTQIFSSPVNSRSWAQLGTDCATGNCTMATTFNTPGKKFVSCNAYASTLSQQCTGNPWCSGFSNDTNPSGFPNATPQIACAGWTDCGANDVITTCVEGGPYVSAWDTWGGCRSGVYDRFRSRSCTEDCGGNLCQAYFADPANCPTGGNCSASLTGSTWTQIEVQNCTGNISGTFFDASDLAACPADPQTLAPGLKINGGRISAVGTASYNAVTDVNGHYSLAVRSPDTYALTAVPPAPFVATPKFSCQGQSAVLAGSPVGCDTQPCETSTNDFGFWRTYSGWWQAVGGGVYGGTGITSNIPGSLPANQRYLILADANGQDGLAAYLSGSINLGTYPGLTVSPSGWNTNSGYGGDRQDYSYWMGKLGFYTKTAWDGSGKPVYSPGTNDYQIYTYGTGTETITINFSPAAGEKVLYLINGNVNVTGNVTVPKTAGNPAFLAVIAKGTITFASNVTNAQGLWVGKNIAIASTGNQATENQFVGEGSFVGWDSISMTRDRGATNNSAPAEKFVFRPDLLVNAPEPMKVANTIFRLETP